MRTLIAVLIVLIAFDASAGAHRPQTLWLPWYPGLPRCVGDYVVVGKFEIFERELARVPCSELPKCVDIWGYWPDDLIFGFMNGEYIPAIRTKAGNPDDAQGRCNPPVFPQ